MADTLAFSLVEILINIQGGRDQPAVKYTNNSQHTTNFWKLWNAQLILNTQLNLEFFFNFW